MAVLVDAAGVTVARADRVLFDRLSVTVADRDRLGVVGINGTGKSTLLRVLAGTQEPEAGQVRRGRGVRVGFLDQEAPLPAGTVGQAVGDGWESAAVLDRLGMSALVDRDVADLSGGQAKRVALARVLSHPAELLILDEPTNHLDLESREALEAALGAFPGSLLLVSHDRALLDAVGSRTVALEDQQLHSYVGGWPEYLRVRAERAKEPAADSTPTANVKSTRGPVAAPAAPTAAAATTKPGGGAKKRTPPKPRGGGRSQRSLEAEIEAAEAALRTVEHVLSDPSAWATPEATARSTARHEEARQAVAALYERWEAVAG
ncbi:MAG TPA: ATP-binding cassette domain-containing protein [Acidimicrobiales bacterium]|nr:ATP-binding cassette domain-containing protein [Acidimicrobiales bacterium]